MQAIIFSVYDDNSGRCKVCNGDTLWGDAPHKLGCEFDVVASRIEEKYQPAMGNLDVSNPPQGGSGVPPKVLVVKME